MSRSLEPKVKSLAVCLRIFVAHTHTQWAWERWRKIWKRDLNRLRIVPHHHHHHPAPSSPTKFLLEAYSARRALSPMQDIKPRDCRLHLEFRVMAKLLSQGITSDGARSKRVSSRGDTQCTCRGRVEAAVCKNLCGNSPLPQFGKKRKCWMCCCLDAVQ